MSALEMQTVQVRTATSSQLDYLMARVAGFNLDEYEAGRQRIPCALRLNHWTPSSNLEQALPFIKAMKVSLIWHDGFWRATNGDGVVEEAFSFAGKFNKSTNTIDMPTGVADYTGYTCERLEKVACKCIIIAKLGETVSVPTAI